MGLERPRFVKRNLMGTDNLLDALQPLLVCHVLPGLVGGLLRWLYSIRKKEYRSRRSWREMLSDIFGGLLVGTILGPRLSSFSAIPPEAPPILEALGTLPNWLTERWLVSALVGFFWLAVLETAKAKVTQTVRSIISKSGRKGGH